MYQLYSNIKGFRKKLEIFKNSVENDNTTHFTLGQVIEKIKN